MAETTVLGVRFTAAERAAIDLAAERAKVTAAQWVRDVACREARRAPGETGDRTPIQEGPVRLLPRAVQTAEQRPFQSFSKDAQVAHSPKGSK